MDTKHIQIRDYDYPLPDERIAKFPLPERDSSKLLVYKDGHISETVFRSLPSLLPEGALMVFNNTKSSRHVCISAKMGTGLSSKSSSSNLPTLWSIRRTSPVAAVAHGIVWWAI